MILPAYFKRAAPALLAACLSSAGAYAAPICTIAPNTARPAPGAAVILTASCVPAATSYLWTGEGIPTATSVPSVLTAAPSTGGSFTYTVKGIDASGASAVASTTITVTAPVVVTPPVTPVVPVIPPTTTPVDVALPSICPVSYVEPANIQRVDLVLNGGESAAVPLTGGAMVSYRFTPSSGLRVGRVEMKSDNYIDGKDVAISPCRGDFARTLPNECVSYLMGSAMLMFDADSAKAQRRCHVAPGATYFVNVRMSYPTTGSIVTVSAREYR
jgi:hypothetical protein